MRESQGVIQACLSGGRPKRGSLLARDVPPPSALTHHCSLPLPRLVGCQAVIFVTHCQFSVVSRRKSLSLSTDCALSETDNHNQLRQTIWHSACLLGRSWMLVQCKVTRLMSPPTNGDGYGYDWEGARLCTFVGQQMIVVPMLPVSSPSTPLPFISFVLYIPHT